MAQTLRLVAGAVDIRLVVQFRDDGGHGQAMAAPAKADCGC